MHTFNASGRTLHGWTRRRPKGRNRSHRARRILPHPPPDASKAQENAKAVQRDSQRPSARALARSSRAAAAQAAPATLPHAAARPEEQRALELKDAMQTLPMLVRMCHGSVSMVTDGEAPGPGYACTLL